MNMFSRLASRRRRRSPSPLRNAAPAFCHLPTQSASRHFNFAQLHHRTAYRALRRAQLGYRLSPLLRRALFVVDR